MTQADIIIDKCQELYDEGCLSAQYALRLPDAGHCSQSYQSTAISRSARAETCRITLSRLTATTARTDLVTFSKAGIYGRLILKGEKAI